MKKLGFLMIMAFLLANNSCSKKEELAVPLPYINFILVNNSDIDTHMWITGEDIMPTNKLAPGGKREVSYLKSTEVMEGNQRDEEVLVYAGRNGEWVARKTYHIAQADEEVTASYMGASWIE